ncbi:MAG: hypothetical protein A2293_02105 [Elusimicrobia bacterium RIFOXYB2_FULL_49_7]|nr:MAG: hypothetical protein A2293_02105 [Elusimicrobia bacterium RIFOXYB2_FULL_49_7]
MKKRDSVITILLVRSAGQEIISLKLHTAVIKLLLVLFIVFTISLVFFAGYYNRISAKVFFIKNVLLENKELKDKTYRIDMINQELSRLKGFEKKLKIVTRHNEDERSAPTLPNKKALENQSDTSLDEFVEHIKLRRNLSYLSIQDDALKRKRMVESIPNIFPVDGWISRGFEKPTDKSKKSHLGLDIAAASDSRIKASAPGIVTFSGWNNDFGNLVEIDHGHGFVTRYGHCSRVLVRKGDLVDRSQTIAFVGSSGRSSAPHLHFEIIKDGVPEDALLYLYK